MPRGWSAAASSGPRRRTDAWRSRGLSCARGDLARAHALLREAVARSPGRVMFHYWLAALLGHLGDARAAGAQARALLALQPAFTVGGVARLLAVLRRPESEAWFLEGLRKAGLPE